jgi:transketolase
MMRALPDISVTVPCDNIEAEKATIAIGKTKEPAYVRFSRDKSVVMTTEKTPYTFGKAQVFWTSANPKVALVGTGYMVYYCLLAAKALEKLGIESLVVNNPTIKPLDEKLLLDVAKQTGAVVSVEDHQITGGLGGALSELFAKKLPTPMEFIGLQNTFGESGKPEELIEKYGMGEKAIVASVKKLLERK